MPQLPAIQREQILADGHTFQAGLLFFFAGIVWIVCRRTAARRASRPQA